MQPEESTRAARLDAWPHDRVDDQLQAGPSSVGPLEGRRASRRADVASTTGTRNGEVTT